MFWGISTKYEHELTTTSYQFVRDMHTCVKYSHQYFLSNEKLYIVKSHLIQEKGHHQQ
jgi:hypothetical protein